MDAERLAEFVARKSGASAVRVDNLRKLSGGAVQENWAVDLTLESASAQTIPAVVRCDAQSGVAESRTRAQEFMLLLLAFAGGVTVPEPLWLGEPGVLQGDFFVMRRVEGVAAGHRLVRDTSLGGDRVRLTEHLGEEIARIQRLQPGAEFSFLERPSEHPALHFVRKSRAFLDLQPTAYPALEWGLRWLERMVPEKSWDPRRLVVAHRDFRTGNLMMDGQGLVAVLDWEFAAWSHPLEDLGWLCARCWRFGARGEERAAGGFGSREDLLRGYNRVAGARVMPTDLYYWEVLAEVRWAMIAIAQAERHRSGREHSLELALTAHLLPQLELSILGLTGIEFPRKSVGEARHA